jgi:hypothetical protein
LFPYRYRYFAWLVAIFLQNQRMGSGIQDAWRGKTLVGSKLTTGLNLFPVIGKLILCYLSRNQYINQWKPRKLQFKKRELSRLIRGRMVHFDLEFVFALLSPGST